MEDADPPDRGGLPDAGGLNIDYGGTMTVEPTEDQLEMLRADLEAIADNIRPHLTRGFTVTTRLDRTPDGLQGQVLVEFPTGDTIEPGIPITADRFDGADRPDWDGPIPPEEIETLSREITVATVTRWARALEQAGGGESRPAS